MYAPSKTIIPEKNKNVKPFQNGGRITDFYFASFRFLVKIWKKKELACQNIHEHIWQTQKNTLNNRFLQVYVLFYILFIQKSSYLF